MPYLTDWVNQPHLGQSVPLQGDDIGMMRLWVVHLCGKQEKRSQVMVPVKEVWKLEGR